MTRNDPYKLLGLTPEASEKEIKSAYRKLALKYHPDRNPSANAEDHFQQITEAYDYLLEHQGEGGRAMSYQETMAREVYRRERERMKRNVRARQEQKRKEEEFFNQPQWHDPILAIKYLIHVLAILMAVSAVLFPIIYAILTEPVSLAGTSFFIIAGAVVSVYIWQKRRTWFRLGKFKTRWKDVRAFLSMNSGKETEEHCCFTTNRKAGGKSYRIELLKTVEIRYRSFGVLNHEAGFKNRVKRVVIPRSVKAEFYHHLSTILKLFALAACLIFFPVESYIWRFMAGLLAGGLFSGLVLGVAGVRSKVSYLFTPGLIIKAGIWLVCLSAVSTFGPGLNVQTSGYIYLVVAGLLFLLDMFFDLIMGLFPFYRWLFRPVIRQGRILESLYKEGYQNYQEVPVMSVVFPLFRWIF